MDKEALINGYFENSLGQDQLKEFEQLLKTDPEFATEVDFQKELQQSLKKNERQEIKQMFRELNTEVNKPETKVFRLRPWLAAASIALLAGIGAWMLFFNTPEINTDQLYAANFTPYENVVHPIERGTQLEDLKTRAFTAYENEDFSLALQLFDELNTKQTDGYIDFYSAIVYMQLGNHAKAIPLLKGYIDANGELKDRATWYLALSHLKQDDLEATKAELKNLIKMGSFKKEDAEKLLKTLS